MTENKELRRNQDQFQLRLPDGLRDRLKADAKANERSLNAEIVARLLASEKFSIPLYMDAVEARLTEIERHLRHLRGEV